MIINSLKKHVVEKTENKRNISEYRELSQNHFQPRYVVKYAKKQRISSHVQLIVLQPRDQYVFYTCLVFCIELLNLKWSTETAIYNSWPQNMVKLVFCFLVPSQQFARLNIKSIQLKWIKWHHKLCAVSLSVLWEIQPTNSWLVFFFFRTFVKMNGKKVIQTKATTTTIMTQKLRHLYDASHFVIFHFRIATHTHIYIRYYSGLRSSTNPNPIFSLKTKR